MCLLCGCSLNAALKSGDSLLRLNAEKCFEEHNQLEKEGRRYRHTLGLILKNALDIGIIKRAVDLSADPTFLIYWGKKMIERWGTVFSTMYNRALPGLFPLTCFDLFSGLFLYIDNFIGKARRDRRGKIKNLGKVVATKVLRCVDFLEQPNIGLKIRSLTGDEGIVSKHLLNELKKRKIKHLFALKSTSKLRKKVPSIKHWSKLKDGRLIGIKRNVTYYGVRTNLIAIKDQARTYLYVMSHRKSAKYAWKMFSRRGKHENGIGVAKSSIGFEDGRPSTNLFQIKGHALACIYLLMLLKALCEKLNLGENNFEPKTFRNLFERECYVRWEGGRMIALVIVSRTLLRRIGTSRIEWEGGTIEFLWHQERRGGTALKIPAKG